METLKYQQMIGKTMSSTLPGNSHTSDPEVESLLLSTCWSKSSQSDSDYLLDSQNLIIENSLSNDKLLESSIVQDTEITAKATIDVFDNLLLHSPINSNLAELKPLPPFSGYTANLNINGIQGHHYHAIAQRIPEENNNTYNTYSNEHNIVSSSTCIGTDSRHLQNADSSVKSWSGVEECSDVKLEYSDCVVNPDSCLNSDSVTQVKTELGEYDISSIEDIAAIIGSAIADTTVPNNNSNSNTNTTNNQNIEDDRGSRDSWMDIDEWINGACANTDNSHKSITISNDSLSEFILPHNTPPQNNIQTSEYTSNKIEYQNKLNQGTSTLQSLLTHGYMPLLQNRLQNGPPIKTEAPSSTSYGVDLISTSSPPSNVVSTTDNILLNGRYIQQSHYIMGGLNDHDRIRSPDILGQNYPHTTTTTPNAPKKSRNRTPKKQQQHASSSTSMFATDQTLGLLGKEKPVHRCSICNRGFLNKSNIKVHLRTHTGEKPFRCEVCAKAFRQKAHLIKHQQIHKRIGRD